VSGFSVRAGAGYSLSAIFSTSSWEPARLATTANVAALAGGAPSTADGVAVALNDRILVRSQAALPTNGIYVVSVVGTGVNGTWVRAPDASSSSDFVDGKTIAVGQGDTLADTMWQFTSNATFTLGVSNVVFITGSISATGWVRDVGPPAVVRLITSTDQVGIGTVTPLAGSKFEALLDDAVNAGVSYAGVLTHTTSGVPGNGIGAGLLFRAEGTGGTENVAAVRAVLVDVDAVTTAGVLDLYTRNGGTFTGRWRVEAPGALTPLADASYGVGSSGLRIAGFYADTSGFNVYLAAAAANPAYTVTGSGLRGGPGGATALDARLYRSALNTWTVDNGGGGAAVLSVLGILQSQARVVATAFKVPADSPYTVTATDDFVGVNTTTGIATVLLPVATTGRRLVIKNTALLGVVNALTVTPNGANTIDGVAASIPLTGTQSVTLTGDATAPGGWYVS
jgi:hypothetical protein